MEDLDAGTLTCVKDFAEKLYATADADLGEYALTNGIDASFTVTAMVDGNPAHSATPTAGNIDRRNADRNPLADGDKRSSLALPGVTGTVYAPIDAKEITASIGRSNCGNRIGSRSIRLCADVSSEESFTRTDASIKVTLDSVAWSALKYKESSFTFRKRSNDSTPWAAVPKCATDPVSECYSVTPNRARTTTTWASSR